MIRKAKHLAKSWDLLFVGTITTLEGWTTPLPT
jgi:hypothetical protein